MPVGIEAWLVQVPPVTRAWLLLSVATTLAVVMWVRTVGVFVLTSAAAMPGRNTTAALLLIQVCIH